MGLSNLVKAVPENLDPVVGEITVHGELLRFRRPEPAHIKSEAEVSKDLAKLAPDYMGADGTLIYVLGTNYVPSADEGEVEPYKIFAEIAEKNSLFFLDLAEAFFQAFPALSDWLGARAAAKNASRGGSEETASESSSLPSPSGATPTASQD